MSEENESAEPTQPAETAEPTGAADTQPDTEPTETATSEPDPAPEVGQAEVDPVQPDLDPVQPDLDPALADATATDPAPATSDPDSAPDCVAESNGSTCEAAAEPALVSMLDAVSELFEELTSFLSSEGLEKKQIHQNGLAFRKALKRVRNLTSPAYQESLGVEYGTVPWPLAEGVDEIATADPDPVAVLDAPPATASEAN